jgi:hypothetical protein
MQGLHNLAFVLISVVTSIYLVLQHVRNDDHCLWAVACEGVAWLWCDL